MESSLLAWASCSRERGVQVGREQGEEWVLRHTWGGARRRWRSRGARRRVEE